jgi:transposase
MPAVEELIEALQVTNEALTTENQVLTIENGALKLKISELEEKLGLNSKNSSIPSSRELYKIKKDNKAKSERGIGGQRGHKGNYRSKMVADEIVKISLAQFCECGGEISISGKAHI